MAAQTWTSLQNSVVAMLTQAPSPYLVLPPDFVTLFPQATSYAEQRIYRELVPLDEREVNSSLKVTPGSRAVSLAPTSQLVLTVERFGLLYPSSVTVPALGTIYYFDAATLDVIDLIWPNQSITMDPSLADWIGRYWTLQDDATLVFCPTPPAAYTVVLTGTFEIIPISVSNPQTYLSTVYPELLQAACMVFLTGGVLRNFGAQSDDPKMAQSWENQYKTLLASAIIEEQRRRLQGAGWTQYAPAPLEKEDRS